MKKISILMIIMLLLTSVVGCAQEEAVGGVESSISELGDIKNIKTIADQVNVYEGCSPNSNVLQTLGKDTQLNVIGQVEDWYAVKMADNNIGFVPESQGQPIVPDSPIDNIPGPTTPSPQMMQTPEGEPTPEGETNQETPQDTPEPETIPEPQTTPLEVGPDNTNDAAPNIPSENTNAPSLTNDEQEMIRLVNEARAQNNLSALKVEMEVTNVARIKSQDMIDNNYFSHNSPTYGSPFDMMKDFGIEYVRAGENIAGNQSVQSAHDALMNSPGHRKNILSPDFTHIGIGIKDGGQYSKMFCQMFISKPK